MGIKNVALRKHILDSKLYTITRQIISNRESQTGGILHRCSDDIFKGNTRLANHKEAKTTWVNEAKVNENQVNRLKAFIFSISKVK